MEYRMSVSLKQLNEQVMVITGASSGIGLATVEDAANAGAKLVLCARSEETLRVVTEWVTENGGEAIFEVADVSERSAMERVAARAIERFGRIDTWVNDAGLSIYGKLE